MIEERVAVCGPFQSTFMARYIPQTDETGQVKLVQVTGHLLKTDWANRPYAEQMMRGYYDLECCGRYREPADMNKAYIKKVWKERMERGV